MEAFAEKVSSKLTSALDSHLSDIRAELRDTREATRDRFDTNIQQLKQELYDVERRLMAEMPKSIFGKRGSYIMSIYDVCVAQVTAGRIDGRANGQKCLYANRARWCHVG